MMIKMQLQKPNHDTIINNADINIFVDFAKKYNIFQALPHSTMYKEICDKIKARLDREGLDYEIVRPE